MVIEHADFEGVERLAAATGAEILSTFDNPERKEEVLGYAEKIEEIMIGEDKVIRFSGCKKDEACTIVLRGASTHILDEAERSLHDALCILLKSIRNPRFIWGGGFTEMKVGSSLENISKKFEGKLSLSIASFANAIQRIPEILVENAGLESLFLLNKFRNSLKIGKIFCLNIDNEDVLDAKQTGLIENTKLKTQIIISAVEAIEMIIRIDKMFLNS
jgi:T-complex protein 1 subunit beta